MHPMLNVAVRAARRAGRIINRASLDLETVAVMRKQRNDFVTEVDRAAEQAIIETLLGAWPDHTILGEESGHIVAGKSGPGGRAIEQEENVWIIDPLDGTTNYIHGFPVYGISIALAVAGRVEQASAWAERSYTNLPSFLMVVALVAATRALGGRMMDARRAMDELRTLDPELRLSRLGAWLPIHRPEHLSIFADGLRKAGLPE